MTTRLELKADLTVTDTGEIEGIAWPFGSADRVGEVIEKGAITSPKTLRMLFGHDQGQVVGVWNDIEETDAGLTVKGRLLIDDVERAREVRAMIRAERAFTSEEVIKLINGPSPSNIKEAFRPQVIDALKMSLLSGMRLGEVLTLLVEEVHDGVFDIRQGKTSSAIRKVPVHPDLSGIVESRTKGKGPKDFLFHELKNERDPVDIFVKRFRRYRVKVGVDDKAEGKRRSLVNFHSARRWFITSARHAGQAKETIADVVGHAPDTKDITFGVYTAGASEAQWRACVESVSLPNELVSGEV